LGLVVALHVRSRNKRLAKASLTTRLAAGRKRKTHIHKRRKSIEGLESQAKAVGQTGTAWYRLAQAW